MSFTLPVEAVERVLLADRWHRVQDGSFEVARSFELVEGDELVLIPEGPVFSFVERRGWRRVRVSGPLSAVLAFQEREQGADDDDTLEWEEGDEELEEDAAP